MSFTFIDLFAGIGGFRLAFEAMNHQCVFSSEWDKFAIQTYMANFDDIPYGDITKISTDNIPDHDILTAGFPCQPFSTIGKREGFEHATQGTLFFDVARIIADKRPKTFVLENVEGLKNHDNGNTYKIIKETLEDELNYTIFDEVLDAANYGVPQHRKRIYIVGFRSDIASHPQFDFRWSEPEKETVGIGQFVEQHDEGYNISEHLQKVYIFKKDDGRPQIITPESDFPVKTLVASYHKIQRLTGTFVRDGSTGLRLLSENECKAIMGFPQDFIIPVSRTQMYRQFGNAVAVPVVKKIAESMTMTLRLVAERELVNE
ncbi:MAG: DNA cytosine methyltransferase [Chloroflexota bacterium]